MSDTPETDAVVKNDCGGSGYIHNLAKLAEKLERERDEARRDLFAASELNASRLGTLKAELAEARRQASVWEKLALREASINGARLCGKEEAK